jgi:phosphodiester glycosidase
MLLLAAPAYSYTTTMMQPSSLPLWPRTVEWIRANHGNWLVDEVEHYYYSWKAPGKGGPQLTSLPSVGVGPAAVKTKHRHVVAGTPLPPPIKPLFAQALPGEGVWKGTGPVVNGRPPVLLTTFRPMTDYPRIVAYVAWFDHTRTAAAWYPGRYEPPNAPVRGPMEIPYDQRWRLLATFNGGFIYKDGNNGSSIGGRGYEPLKQGLATLIGYTDGHVNVTAWHGGPVAGPQVAFARQSLPLIVDNGRLNPALNDSSQWGYTLGNATRVWRTGAGIDRHGNLIYAAADWQTVTSLAKLLQHAGAVRAMQLDINPEWPTLITYRHSHGLQPDRIVPNYQQSPSRYLVPDDRDFFAIYQRLPGPVSVPFK